MDNKDKKDELLASVFDNCKNGIQPPPHLVMPAAALLHAQNIEKKRRIEEKKKIFKKRLLLASAMSIIAIIALSIIIPLLINLTPNHPSYYSINSLSSDVISKDDVEKIRLEMNLKNDLFPTFDSGFDEQYKLFYFTETDAPSYIVYKTRHIIDGANIDLRITAELTNSVLDDRRDFYSLPNISINNVKVNFLEEYRAGEYITEGALKHNGIKYYFEAMSPSFIAIDEYALLILNL